MQTKRPPGPKGRLFLGSAQDFGPEKLNFLLDLAKTYGDIAYMRLAHYHVYLISDPAIIREILVTKSSLFEKATLDKKILRKFLGNGLLTSEGAFHRRQRQLAQPAFHTSRIQNYAEIMVNYTKNMLDHWEDGGTVDIAQQMAHLTMLIVSKTLFDADAVTTAGNTAAAIANAIHDLQAASNQDYTTGFPLPDWIPTSNNRRRNKANKTFQAAMGQIIAERRATAVHNQVADKGDLLSMLMLTKYEDGSVMADKQLLEEVATLFAAGHETTSNALTWTWYLLAQHPEVEAKLLQEIDLVLNGRLPTLEDLAELPYSGMVIKESMRLYPPAWILNGRTPTQDVELGAYKVPKNSTIFISPYVMHHLPQYFPNPEQFQPERFLPEREKELPKFAYFPFGGGPRVCIGNAFAMMEAQLVLVTVAQNYKLRLEPNQHVLPLPQITLIPEGGIQMKLTKRKPEHPNSQMHQVSSSISMTKPSIDG